MANPTQAAKETRESLGNAADHAREAVSGLAEQARQGASHLADQARQGASHLADQARQGASQLADQARQVGNTAAQRADNVAGRVGSGLESAAGTIRENSPNSGMLGTAASRVADTLESGGKYLEKEGFTGLVSDVTELIKKNPIPALLVAVAAGVLIARATSRR